MIIYGAGMSGLLAAHMLRRFEPVVHEAAESLPNNHAALLRFRTDAVSRETGIPFKKVWVQKAVMGLDGKLTTKPTIQEQNLYSLKVTGTLQSRSIGNLEPCERYIAPEDFISQLAKGLNIRYGCALKDVCDYDGAKISTIPMNILMDIADWKNKPEFRYSEIITITADITGCDSDIYQTIYHPDPSALIYRTSITGNKLIIEMVADKEIENMELFEENSFVAIQSARGCLRKFVADIEIGNVKAKRQKYGKLINSTGRAGREFMMAMTDLHGIYSVGRFATWRQLLMDDVVKDIRIVERMIEDRDSYSRRMKAL